MVTGGVRVMDEGSIHVLMVATSALLKSDHLNTFFVLESSLFNIEMGISNFKRVSLHVLPWFWAGCH